MIKQGKIELSVGIFTILGMAVLCFLVFFVSDIYVFKKGYELNARFGYVSILDRGAAVRMAGVRVGEVKQVEMLYDEKTRKPFVNLVLFVNDQVIIREKTQVTIQGTTPLSEPHVAIMSVGLDEGTPLEPGATIRGIDPIPMEKLVITANEIADRMKEIVDRVGTFFEDKEISTAVKNTILNLDKLTESMNQILTGKREDIAKSITNFEKSVENLDTTLAQIKSGKGTAGKLLMDEELYNELLAFVKDLKAHPWKLLAKPKDSGKKSFLIF